MLAIALLLLVSTSALSPPCFLQSSSYYLSILSPSVQSLLTTTSCSLLHCSGADWSLPLTPSTLSAIQCDLLQSTPSYPNCYTSSDCLHCQFCNLGVCKEDIKAGSRLINDQCHLDEQCASSFICEHQSCTSSLDHLQLSLKPLISPMLLDSSLKCPTRVQKFRLAYFYDLLSCSETSSQMKRAAQIQFQSIYLPEMYPDIAQESQLITPSEAQVVRNLDYNCLSGSYKHDTGNCFTFQDDSASYLYEGCSNASVGLVCDVTSFQAALTSKQTVPCTRLPYTLQNGLPCTANSDCLSETCGSSGFCIADLNEGQHCVTSYQCSNSLKCALQENSSTRTCSQLKSEGSTCELDLQNCQSSYYCKQPISVTPNICQATVADSSVCDSANPCNPYTQYCSDNICRNLPGLEESCYNNNGALLCREGFFCDEESSECKLVYTASPNTCQKHDQCAITHYCKDNMCIERGIECSEDVESIPDDRMCTYDRYCGNCFFGVCECLTKLKEGSCESNSQCQSGKCQDQSCVVPSLQGQTCNGLTTGCYDYGESFNWGRCNTQSDAVCASRGDTDSACDTSSVCLSSHFCESLTHTCQPKVTPTRACQGYDQDECTQGYICHLSICTAYLSIAVGNTAKTALVCASGALYNGQCEQVTLTQESVYCDMGSLCAYTTTTGLQLRLECECGGNLGLSKTTLNGHCPVPAGTQDESRLLQILNQLHILSPTHFLQKQTKALEYIESTLLNFSPQDDSQRQLYYLAISLTLRLKLPAQVHNEYIMDSRLPSYRNSPQISILPSWALRFTNLELFLGYISKYPNCGMHTQTVQIALKSVNFHPLMTSAEVTLQIMIMEKIFQKMCQKHGDYSNVLSELSTIMSAYFSRITSRLKEDEARFYLSILNLADIVAISNTIDNFKTAVDLLASFSSQMTHAPDIDLRSQNLSLFSRFQGSTIETSSAADTYDKMIYTWATLLDSEDKDTKLLAIQNKISDWMESRYNSHTSTLQDLTSQFETVFTATTQIDKIATDFPTRRDTNYWRNYFFDFAPRAAKIEIVNTESDVISPTDSGVILIADVTTARSVPSLPVSGCGMQDLDNTELASKMKHDRVLLFAEVATGMTSLEYEVQFNNGAVVLNSFTPACCIQLENDEWNVISEVVQQGQKYNCKFTKAGVVSMLYYNDNLYDLSRSQFQSQVYWMDEAKLRDFMAFVGQATFETDERLYKMLISDAASCIDCLEPIFKVVESFRAVSDLYYFEDEIIMASKYFFQCLEKNFFSPEWEDSMHRMELIEAWSPTDLSQTDHYSQKLDVATNQGETDPQTQTEAECETVFFFFPAPGFFFFQEKQTVHLNVSHVKVPRNITQEVPEASRLIFNEFIAHQGYVQEFKIHTLISLGMESKNHTLLDLANLENKFELTMLLKYDPPAEVLCAQIFMTKDGTFVNWRGVDTLRREQNQLVCRTSETGLFAAVSLVQPQIQNAVFVPLVLFFLISSLCIILLGCGFKRFFKIFKRLKSKHKEQRVKAIKQRFLHLSFKELKCNLLFCTALRYCLPLVNLFHFYDKQSSLKIQLFLKALGLLLRMQTLLCLVMTLASDENGLTVLATAMAGAICLFPHSALRDCLSRSKSNFSPIYFQVTPYFLTTVRSQKIHSERGSETNRKLNSLTKEETPSHCDTPAVTLAYSKLKFGAVLALILLNVVVLYFGVILAFEAPLFNTLILFFFSLVVGFLFGVLKLAIVSLFVFKRGQLPQHSRNALCAGFLGFFLDSQVFVVANEVFLNRPSVIGLDSSPQ